MFDKEPLGDELLQAAAPQSNASLPVFGALSTGDGLKLIGRYPTAPEEDALAYAATREALQVEARFVTCAANAQEPAWG